MTYKTVVTKLRNTISEQESIITQLRIANDTLLSNNVKLAEESKMLNRLLGGKDKIIDTLRAEKSQCKQKCELAIQQKERIITDQSQRLARVKSLKDIHWTQNITDNQIVLTGVLPHA